MNWFSPKTITLTLEPDESGKKLAGFHSGKPLAIQAKVGESIQAVMDRFNIYRGPDSQIRRLWSVSGTILSFSTILSANMNAVVRAESA